MYAWRVGDGERGHIPNLNSSPLLQADPESLRAPHPPLSVCRSPSPKRSPRSRSERPKPYGSAAVEPHQSGGSFAKQSVNGQTKLQGKKFLKILHCGAVVFIPILSTPLNEKGDCENPQNFNTMRCRLTSKSL